MIDTRFGNRRIASTLLALFAAVVAGASWARADGPAVVIDRPAYEPELTSKTIAFWESQAKRDPQGALELRELAGAYLARQRETGAIADAVKAEDAARRSLKILPRGNGVAWSRLGRSLLAQHRFSEALAAAKRAAAHDDQGGRLVADIELELGNYDAAERALANESPQPDDMNLLALRARLDAINGRPDDALRHLKDAARLVESRPDVPAETAAWYHTMVGHTLIDAGRLDDGEAACRKALAIFPRDYRAMTGLAEAANWRHDPINTLAWARKAIAIAPQNPEALRLIGDALAAQGKTPEAEAQYALLKTLAHSFPRIYDRHWVIFCADHGRDLDEALALARKDLELRHDVHAYDTLAWACFKKGLLNEADAMSKKALARGVQEPSLYQHASEIARAKGETTLADGYLAKAKALNSYLAR